MDISINEVKENHDEDDDNITILMRQTSYTRE